jgi:hypothetical protein
MATIPLVVETYSGTRADERPLVIVHRGRRVAVREILDRWLGEGHAYFKLVGEDTVCYLIRHDLHSDTWELILMEVSQGSPPRRGH